MAEAAGVAEGIKAGINDAVKGRARAPLAFATIVIAFVFWLAMHGRLSDYGNLARGSNA